MAFVPLYALWVTLLLPGVWASMLAGALFGTWWGSLVVFVGACLGAEIVFFTRAGPAQGWARRRLAAAPKLLAVEQAVSREGLRFLLLTRLSPAFPFQLTASTQRRCTAHRCRQLQWRRHRAGCPGGLSEGEPRHRRRGLQPGRYHRKAGPAAPEHGTAQ